MKALTCDVILLLSPVEVCDTLLANQDDVGIEAQLLQLFMPLLSLQVVTNSKCWLLSQVVLYKRSGSDKAHYISAHAVMNMPQHLLTAFVK